MTPNWLSVYVTKFGGTGSAVRASQDVPSEPRKAVRRVPQARLPRRDRPHRAGVVGAFLFHALALAGLVTGGGALATGHRAIGLPGEAPGGGGGGGRVRHYVALPAFPAAVTQAPQAEKERRVEARNKPPVEPETILPPPLPQQEKVLPELALAERLETLGAGSGVGSGAGTGSGTGGGIGSGSGTGVGSGTGAGVGGDSGAVLAPEPRAVLYPFERPPDNIAGRQFKLRFSVDRQGRVTRVVIEPEIAHAAFRKKLLERLMQWTFYPARTLDGTAVPGEVVITYVP